MTSVRRPLTLSTTGAVSTGRAQPWFAQFWATPVVGGSTDPGHDVGRPEFSTVITPQRGKNWSCVAGLLSSVDEVLFRRKAARDSADDLGFVVDLTEVVLAHVGSAA